MMRGIQALKRSPHRQQPGIASENSSEEQEQQQQPLTDLSQHHQVDIKEEEYWQSEVYDCERVFHFIQPQLITKLSLSSPHSSYIKGICTWHDCHQWYLLKVMVEDSYYHIEVRHPLYHQSQAPSDRDRWGKPEIEKIIEEEIEEDTPLLFHWEI